MGAALDARALREAMVRYLEALEAHREEIDSLNVFPVPDGDTGTNMLLTQRSVVEALGAADGSLAQVGEAAARGALRGARGSSGVLLSQILRGLWAEVGAADGPAGGADLARGLRRAAAEARTAVADPVEGTILSVLDDAAAAAGSAARREGDPGAVAAAALEAAVGALERTPERLPDLALAGVVDAGGKGLVLLLDALVSALRDVPRSVAVGPIGPVRPRPREARPARYRYEVMYLLDAHPREISGLRRRLSEVGDSVAVVGGGGTYRVHVHADDPGAAVEAGIERGRASSIRIGHLEEAMAEGCPAGEGRAPQHRGRAVPRHGPVEAGAPVVAVVEGHGLVEIFRSLGAAVVPGGPGRIPSVRELVAAAERAPGEAVFLLPNHPSVLPAAEAAAAETGKDVRVVPTRSVPEGISAALAFSPEADPARNAERMEEAGRGCAWGALARAVRDADVPAGRIRAGAWLALAGDDARLIGEDPAALAGRMVAEALRTHGHELASVYVGEEGSSDEAGRIAEAIREAAGLAVEVHRGGQRAYPYLIGVE